MGMKMPEGVNPNLQAMQGGVVESFFASLLDSKTPLLEKYRAYDLYNKGKEEELTRYEFEKKANFMSKIRWLAHVITSEYAIIEGINEEDNHVFKWMLRSPDLNDHYIISNVIYQSFDEALLAVIVYKYSGMEDTYMLMQGIGMKSNNYEINKAKGYIKKK